MQIVNSHVSDIVSDHRVTLLASCVMNLEQFPLDSQTCHLKFGSCKYCLYASFSTHFALFMNNTLKNYYLNENNYAKTLPRYHIPVVYRQVQQITIG